MRKRALASLADGATVFAGSAEAKLGRLRDELAPLAARYDVVVANPPYMGSSSMNGWLAGWTKKRYPNSKRDLCTCFIERGFGMLACQGYSAMVTMESWMFLGSFEMLRKSILEEHSIATLVYMNHMVMRIAFNTCATVFRNEHTDVEGVYTQVYYEDLGANGEPVSFPSRHKSVASRGAGHLEALADPGCGWFFRQNGSAFERIPSCPIAYWIGTGMMRAFAECKPLSHYAPTRKGMYTGDNQRFLRQWFEVSFSTRETDYRPYNKGGSFRKWYGNRDYWVRWKDNGREIRAFKGSGNINLSDYFKACVTWGLITSGPSSFRSIETYDTVMGDAGPSLYPRTKEQAIYLLSMLNSSCVTSMIQIMNPTLNFSVSAKSCASSPAA